MFDLVPEIRGEKQGCGDGGRVGEARWHERANFCPPGCQRGVGTIEGRRLGDTETLESPQISKAWTQTRASFQGHSKRTWVRSEEEMSGL